MLPASQLICGAKANLLDTTFLFTHTVVSLSVRQPHLTVKEDTRSLSAGPL